MIEKIVLFHNPTDEDFIGYWNSIGETIKAGASRHMELWRAKHYAKHLIDRELNKENIPTDNMVEREKLLSKTVINDEAIEIPQENVAAEIANIEPTEPKKKGGRPKKVIPAEEEFAGLKE